MLTTSKRTLATTGQTNRAGFTLTELLIVISMISIMLSIAGPKITQTFVEANVRSASVDVNAHVAIARQAAIRRARGAVFKMSDDRTKAWVDVDRPGTTPEILGDTLRIYDKYSVTTTATIDTIRYDARGFASLDAEQTFAVTKGSVTKSVCVTAAGFILNGCAL